MIGISGSRIWSKTLMELIFNPCGEFRRSPEGPVSEIHSPHLHVDAPGIFSDLLRYVLMLKREWGAESNGKLPHLSIPSKTEAWVSEFEVEDLPLSRTAALVPEFAVKDLPLGRTLMMMSKKCVCLRPHGRSENFYDDRNRFEVMYTYIIYNMNDINFMDDITHGRLVR